MCSIYNNAHVTLIAACAQKAGDGFLHDRDDPVTMELPVWCPDGRLGMISYRGEEYARRDEPVNQRAWCFQERLLSPRALIYASHTLQYQCNAGIRNVGGANNFHINEGMDDLRMPEAPTQGTSPPSRKESEKLWRSWKAILSDYSRRSLTSPMDKLAALSGVAQYFSRCWGLKTETEYLVGLWKHNLRQDLLWYVSKARKPRPTQYRAPSWSWAATDSHIDNGAWPGIVEALGTIRRCEIKTVKPGLNDIASAKLEVETVLRHVSWDAPRPGKADVPLYEHYQGTDAGQRQEIEFVYLDSDEALEERIGLAVVLGSMNKAVLQHLIGLLVVPLPVVDGLLRYRRVGLFDVHEKIKDDEDEPFCDVEDWLKTEEQVIVII